MIILFLDKNDTFANNANVVYLKSLNLCCLRKRNKIIRLNIKLSKDFKIRMIKRMNHRKKGTMYQICLITLRFRSFDVSTTQLIQYGALGSSSSFAFVDFVSCE